MSSLQSDGYMDVLCQSKLCIFSDERMPHADFQSLCPGDRLRGSEEELAGAVGAVKVEEGDSD